MPGGIAPAHFNERDSGQKRAARHSPVREPNNTGILFST
jgi:hypothetical protein